MLSLQSKLIFKQNNGTELGRIVLNVKAILLAFDDGMASTDTDIIDSYLTLVTSPKLEF